MRGFRRAGLVLGGLAVAAALAVWLVPSALDWTRYRDSIAALTAARLGRPVRIEGGISLTLLPQPVLVASRVLAPDQGDGVAASVGALRLRVALGPLLSGRLVVRELVLSGPVLRLPWPLPQGALALRPRGGLAPFRATVEDGTVSIGDATATAISGTLRTDPDSNALIASGALMLRDQSLRFASRLGPTRRDGSASLSLALDGQLAARDTGGTFAGRVTADGAIIGQASARGPDLGLLLPAPAVPWQAKGPLSVSGGLITADDLALRIAGSPARGAVVLRVAPQARLDIALQAGRLDLDDWLRVLLRGPAFPLPTGVELSAEAATLNGGLLRRARGGFELAGGHVMVRDAAVLLPGDALLELRGALRRNPGDGPGFAGEARLSAPDLRATLRWLGPLAPGLPDPPPGVLRTAELTGQLTLDRGQLSVSGLGGTLDDSTVSGGFGIGFAARPGLGFGLTFDHLDLDAWLPDQPAALAAIARPFTGLDADVHLQVGQARWRGVSLVGLALDARSGAAGVTIGRLAAASAGAAFSASGTIGADGTIADGRLSLGLPDAARLLPLLPAALRDAPDFWRGPMTLRAAASGPPGQLAAQIRVDLGDLRLEAEPVLDLPHGGWSGTITLRHPGVPRLLSALGVPKAAVWLDDGSLSLLAHLSGTAGRIDAPYFEMTAGALRANGGLTLDLTGAEPSVSGQVRADVLPLPVPSFRSEAPLPAAWLRGWRGDVRLTAAQVQADGAPVLDDLTAELSVAAGVARIGGLGAGLNGGRLTAEAMLDESAEPPRATLSATAAGVRLDGPLTGWPVDVAGGQLDGKLALAATGHSPATLLATLGGTGEATVQAATVTGFDLGKAAALLGAAPPGPVEAGLRAALADGESRLASASLRVDIAQGGATLALLEGAGSDGQIGGSGSADLRSGALDLSLMLHPAVPDAPAIGLRLTGTSEAPRRQPEIVAASTWANRRGTLVR